MFIVLLLMTVVAAAAWVYLFTGPRRLPIIPFVDFVQLDAKAYNPVDRLCRLALRQADVSSGGLVDAQAITRSVEKLRQQAAEADSTDPAWHRVNQAAQDAWAKGRPDSVTIIMAVKNQADVLRRTLVGLASQAWWPLRILIADEASTDETPALLAEKAALIPGLDSFTVRNPPADWSQKNWALHQAVMRIMGNDETLPGSSSPTSIPHPPSPESAIGHQPSAITRPDWLLFLAPDAELNPDAIFGVLHTAQKMDLEAVSVLPRVECGSLLEKLMTPFLMNLLALVYPSEPGLTRPQGHYLASESFLLVRRSAYVAVGGHAAVAREQNPDLALATRLFQAGHKIRWFLTRELVRTRSYAGHRSGWEKLADSVCRVFYDRPAKLLLGLMAAVVLGIAPYMSLFFYGELDAYRAVSDPTQAMLYNILLGVASATGVLFSAISLARMDLALGVSIFWSFTLPISSVVFMGSTISWGIKRWIYGREEVRF